MTIFTEVERHILQEITGMTKEQAALYISLIIENGKESFVATLREENSEHPENEAQTEIWKMLILAGEDIFFQNEIVDMSFKIALVRCFQKDKERTEALFLNRMEEIFPPALAKRLYDHVINSVYALELQKKELFPTREKIKQLYELRAAVLRFTDVSIRRKAQNVYKSQGVRTQMVPCPECKEAKRCGPETKRYRCPCGFESTYPLKA